MSQSINRATAFTLLYGFIFLVAGYMGAQVINSAQQAAKPVEPSIQTVEVSTF